MGRLGRGRACSCGSLAVASVSCVHLSAAPLPALPVQDLEAERCSSGSGGGSGGGAAARPCCPHAKLWKRAGRPQPLLALSAAFVLLLLLLLLALAGMPRCGRWLRQPQLPEPQRSVHG